jgi:predicted enzyme related to lactoylglutathione lyase
MVERTHYEPGDFCWIGLATSDPAGAGDFYTSLFGWEVDDAGSGFALFRLEGSGVAVMYRQTPEARAAGAPPHWTSFISVKDADATASRAGELGGAAVFREPFDVLDEGRVAAIRDPAGAMVSLWQPGTRVGAALVNEVGAWSWNELATNAVARARSFYAELLGWEYATAEGGYVVVTNAGHRIGGIREQSESERGMPPVWLPWFTVASADDAARRAEGAGGRTLAVRSRQAIIADPMGAAFCVSEGAADP